jgi:hypothetical protein
MKRLLLIPAFAAVACLLLTAAPLLAQDPVDVDDTATEMVETVEMTMDDMGEIGGAVAEGASTVLIIIVAISILLSLLSLLGIIVTWRIFSKAGKPGVACIVPIWGSIVFCQVGGKPGWWFLLYCIPGVNLVIHILVCIGVAQQFGKGAGFGLGLVFFPIIFLPILAFGSAEHESVMQFPDGGGEGVIGAPTRAPRKPKVITDSTRYAVAAWIGIITLLMLLTIIAFQVYEMHYYSSDLPEHGTGSAWPAKIIPEEGATPAPTPAPEPEPAAPATNAPATNAPVDEATS